MKRNGYFVKSLIALSLVGTLAMADAESSNENSQDVNMNIKSSVQVSQNANEMQEKKATKIGVSDAIQVVKNKFSGKIVGAKLENENGNLVYTVEVLKNNQINNVIVDAGNSKILASKVDAAENVSQNNDEGENDSEGTKENNSEKGEG